MRRCFVASISALLLLTGCFAGFEKPVSQLSSTSVPTEEFPLATPSESGWQLLTAGLEQRVYIPNGNELMQMLVLRIDPAHYIFRVHYRPGEALGLQEWRNLMPDAIVIVNTNFFDAQHNIQGLLISDGVAYGTSYRNRGGTFAGQEGRVEVRSNRLNPYQGETWEQAVQAFPMLVLNGVQAFTDQRQQRPSRRTVIGQDTQGRILLMATPVLGLSLFDLSAYLPTTDMDLANAFNLDGGGSTMMYAASNNSTIHSFDPVPAVLAVYPR